MNSWRTRSLFIYIICGASLLFAGSPKQQSIQKRVHKDLFGSRGLFLSNLHFQDSILGNLQSLRNPQEQAEFIVSSIESEKIKGLKVKSRFLKWRLTKNPEYRAHFLEQLEEAIKSGTLLKEHLETKKANQGVHKKAWEQRMEMGTGTLFLWMGSTMGSMVVAPALGPTFGIPVVLSTFVFSLFHGPILRYKLTQTSGREYRASLKNLKAETSKLSSEVKQVLKVKYKVEAPPNFIKLAALPDGSILSISREQLSAALAFRNTLDIYRSMASDFSSPSLYSRVLIPPAVRSREGNELQEVKEQKLIDYLKQSFENPNSKICVGSMSALAALKQ